MNKCEELRHNVAGALGPNGYDIACAIEALVRQVIAEESPVAAPKTPPKTKARRRLRKAQRR